MTVSPLQALKTRLSAGMRAKRGSPIMATALAAQTALAGAAGLYAASAFSSGGYAPQSVKSEWRPPSLSAFEPLAPKPSAVDTQTLKRPLFAKSRRPAPAKAASSTDRAPESVAATPPALSLAAIARFGAKSRAFLLGNNGADGEWYEVGEKIAGWTVAEIRRTDLKLTSGDRSAELKLYPDRPPVAATASAPPPSPPPPPPFIPDPKLRNRS